MNHFDRIFPARSCLTARPFVTFFVTFSIVVFLGLRLSAQHSQEPPALNATPAASYPNLLVDVSAKMIASGLNLPLDDSKPIQDCILGATVTGQGHTVGNMTAALAANPNHASIQLNVEGMTYTDTVGRKRRVKFWSNGVISFTAQKPLIFDKYGFSAGGATSCAKADVRARCLTAPPMIKHIAWRQVRNQKSEGDWVVARHAEPDIKSSLDNNAQKLVNSANSAYKKWFYDPLVESGHFPQEMDFSTSNNEMQVVVLQAGEGQVGAPQPAPQFQLAHDIGIRMHESAFNNLAETLIGGQTLTDEKLRVNVAKFLTMTSHKEYEQNENELPWSVTFAKKNPIAVNFRDGAYQLVIAGKEWTSGRRRFRAMNITVTYRIESTPDGVRIKRDEDILIAPPGFVRGQSRLSPAVIVLRRILQRKMNHLFPADINPEGLVVPGPWEKAGVLRVARMAADDGWLQLSWAMQSATAADSVLETGKMFAPSN